VEIIIIAIIAVLILDTLTLGHHAFHVTASLPSSQSLTHPEPGKRKS
jgi:hypothetical protein